MLSFGLILITSLFFTGIIGRTKSLMAGRKGPDVFQPIKNVLLLLRKGSVFSSTSGLITQLAPTISLATVLTAALLVPFNGQQAVISFSYDFVLFAYLLALGRFFMIIAALDAGSSFQGMGAARESLYSMLLEPAFFMILASFCLITHNSSFAGIFSSLGQMNTEFLLAAVLAIFVFVNIALVENSRLPVDDPKTHLELTMIHEVMVLDLCGFDLGLVQITSFLKFAIFGTLIANCVMPGFIPVIAQIAIYFAIQMLFAIVIGSVESFRARNRLNRNAQYILAVVAISLIAFVLTLFL
ncbi:MAG: NADH-quinone oxidoreductase subunit H [Bacteroidota bacterium]|nr:NADH-quinone oxidoreductase subunit H [Bacteroidota bacterium]